MEYLEALNPTDCDLLKHVAINLKYFEEEHNLKPSLKEAKVSGDPPLFLCNWIVRQYLSLDMLTFNPQWLDQETQQLERNKK